jgi:hypothetical protein
MQEQQAIALLEDGLTGATTEAQRRTVEELREMMRRLLPRYLKRYYGPRRARGTEAMQTLKALIDQSWRDVLDRNPTGRARFFVGLILSDHLNRLLWRAIYDYDKPFTIPELSAWLLDYAASVREEIYPPTLRPEMPTRQKLGSMVVGYLRRGMPHGAALLHTRLARLEKENRRREEA